MSVQAIRGGIIPVGPPLMISPSGISSNTIDAANEAVIFIGRLVTSDGGSHTLDTSGSSSISWRTDSVTFSNAGTTCSVGVGDADTTAGPPARAVNSTGTITQDVKAVFTGGGGGVTGTAWQTSVPTTGTKTMADGDLIAVSIQLTARAGTDSIVVVTQTSIGGVGFPVVTHYFSSIFSRQLAFPNCIIRFADGEYGWLEGGEVISALITRTWNSGSATKEYGQLYQLPVPYTVRGVYVHGSFSQDCDFVLYSDPLGTPVAEKTVSVDLNTLGGAGGLFFQRFSSPYSVAANQAIGIVAKPGGSSVQMYGKTLGNAAHRVSDPWGTSGYGISRASGAFANANSSLDHYYIGMIVSGLEAGGGGGGAFVIGS